MTELFSQETDKPNIEVLLNGSWIAFNDPPHFKIGTEGFGVQARSKTRKTVSSDFFSGEYTVSERDNNNARQLQVYIFASDRYELEHLKVILLSCFEQEGFRIRTTRFGAQEVEQSSGSADVTLDESHVHLHNLMCVATISFNVLPAKFTREEIEWLSPWEA